MPVISAPKGSTILSRRRRLMGIHQGDPVAGSQWPQRLTEIPSRRLSMKGCRNIIVCALLFAALAQGAPPCEDNMLYGGLPKWLSRAGREKITVLTNCAYMVGYSETRKNPIWVAYHLRKMGPVGEQAKNPKRKDNFRTDPRTAAKVNDEAFDFGKTKCDRGHMAPSYGIGSRYGANAQ